jgi:hypothetical protein
MSQPFTVQTTHCLTSCVDYKSCQNVHVGTSEWGLKCKLCIRNRFAGASKTTPEELAGGLHDNYKSATPPPTAPAPAVASVKKQLIAEVVLKLEKIDEALLKDGCSILINVDVPGGAIKIGVVDNLTEAQSNINLALEHLTRAAALFIKDKPTPVDLKTRTCLRCGKPLPGDIKTCPECSFDNSPENLKAYAEP